MIRFEASDKAVKLITSFEACITNPISLGANLYTFGYKHTGEYNGDKITKEYATNLLKSDLKSYSISLYNIIKKMKLDINQDMFDALVDILFDLDRKAVIEVIRASNINKAAEAILNLKGNPDRRKAEYNLFTIGKFTAPKAEKKATSKKEDKEEVVEEKKTTTKKIAEVKEDKKTVTKLTSKKNIVNKIAETVKKAPVKKTTKKKEEDK